MNDWAVRPLDETSAAVFIDAIVVKVRDGQVANRPFYAAIGVTLGEERDILGLWACTGGEGAKFWMPVLTDLRNRGVKGHLLRRMRRPEGTAQSGGHRLAASDRAYLHHSPVAQHVSDHIAEVLGRDQTRREANLRCSATARSACDELTEKWGQRYPAVIACGSTPGTNSSRSWTTTWRSGG